MTTVLGADWGRGVYVVAQLDPATLTLRMTTARDASALLILPCDVLAVDMPIGLSEDAVRACDRAAREHIPGRKSSVFNVPIRSVLDAPTYAEATAQSRSRTGKGLSPQSFGFMRHIREMDEALATSEARVRERTWEIHPEVSFAALSDGATLAHRKKSDEGAALRIAALSGWLSLETVEQALADAVGRAAARDDVLDALAAAWSAVRIHDGEHSVVTPDTPRDSTGLRMTIAY